MAVTAVLSNHFKYQSYHKKIDLAADSIKILLMRSGFVFNKDLHATKLNVIGTINRSDISFEAATKHIHTAAGDFVAAGFVDGGQITVTGSASNNTTFPIVTVNSATQMTVNETLVEEAAGASVTITGTDELTTGYGYTKDTKTLAGGALAEDDTNDRAEFTCSSVTWTASGGSIGPTPGALLYDDSSDEDTIIGYIGFGAELTATDGANFVISNIKIRLS
jgi:hypothetical protein